MKAAFVNNLLIQTRTICVGSLGLHFPSTSMIMLSMQWLPWGGLLSGTTNLTAKLMPSKERSGPVNNP